MMQLIQPYSTNETYDMYIDQVQGSPFLGVSPAQELPALLLAVDGCVSRRPSAAPEGVLVASWCRPLDDTIQHMLSIEIYFCFIPYIDRNPV